jgi:hypothetical protein
MHWIPLTPWVGNNNRFVFRTFGFARNKHIISYFVSTFLVILDTILKYWIFCHLNCVSPSIVPTYHTMNE